MAKVPLTCNRAGLYTDRCAKPARWRMTAKVAEHRVILLACDECHDRAPASLGAWEPIPK